MDGNGHVVSIVSNRVVRVTPGDAIAVADLGVAGHKLPRWSVDPGPLADLVNRR